MHLYTLSLRQHNLRQVTNLLRNRLADIARLVAIPIGSSYIYNLPVFTIRSAGYQTTGKT